jgi:hypothetical protein
VLEFGPGGLEAHGQSKGMEVLAKDLGIEEGFGFNSHESGED